jgi:hypothetical protein
MDEFRGRVMPPVSVRKDLSLVILLLPTAWESLELRSPHKFEIATVGQLIVIISVHSGEENGVHAHISHQPRIDIGVSEGIKLPAHLGSDSKFLTQPIVALFEVAQHVCIVCGGFIWGDEAALHEL